MPARPSTSAKPDRRGPAEPKRRYDRPVGSVRVILALGVAAASLVVPATAAPAATCVKASPLVVASLRHGLRPSAHATIGRTAAVRARGRFTNLLTGGIYFVSAPVGNGRVATWAVTTAAYRTGHGGVFAVDRNARKVSVLGALISPQLLASWGAGTHTHGYATSRACV
jgi:hypothetical protein